MIMTPPPFRRGSNLNTNEWRDEMRRDHSSFNLSSVMAARSAAGPSTDSTARIDTAFELWSQCGDRFVRLLFLVSGWNDVERISARGSMRDRATQVDALGGAGSAQTSKSIGSQTL